MCRKENKGWRGGEGNLVAGLGPKWAHRRSGDGGVSGNSTEWTSCELKKRRNRKKKKMRAGSPLRVNGHRVRDRKRARMSGERGREITPRVSRSR